jgi:hypothetical protein
LAIVNFSKEAGDAATALQYAQQALELGANDPAIKTLVEQLRRRTSPR